MARITIEDCLLNIQNMYELVHAATKRARQIYKGSESLVRSKNRVIVTSLREIAAGKVRSEGGISATNVVSPLGTPGNPGNMPH